MENNLVTFNVGADELDLAEVLAEDYNGYNSSAVCGGLAERFWDHAALFLWALRSCDSAFLFSAPSRDIVCTSNACACTVTTHEHGSKHPHMDDVVFFVGSFSVTYVKMCCFTRASSSYQKIQLTVPETDPMCYPYSELLFLFKQVIWGFSWHGTFLQHQKDVGSYGELCTLVSSAVFSRLIWKKGLQQ